MANVFLDTNIFIDIQEGRSPLINLVKGRDLHVSVLTIHIFFYVLKYKTPYEEFKTSLESFCIVDFTNRIMMKALAGPTKDYEDNVQLYSAIEARCDLFYTRDSELLKLGYFGSLEMRSTEK